MKILHLDRKEWFDLANTMTTGDMLRWFLAAVELEKTREIPVGALGYDEATDTLYVAEPSL